MVTIEAAEIGAESNTDWVIYAAVGMVVLVVILAGAFVYMRGTRA
jgi:hypothetical protein